jgi:hypothetical protein
MMGSALLMKMSLFLLDWVSAKALPMDLNSDVSYLLCYY